MSRARFSINPKWQEAQEDKITRVKSGGTMIIEYIEAGPKICVQWLIIRLTQENIPFRVMNLGSGVQKVTTETTLCPKCHGSGRI